MATSSSSVLFNPTIVIYMCLLIIVTGFDSCDGRIHTLKLKNDARQSITMSTFGFYKNGLLEVNLSSFTFHPHEPSKRFGFSLERTVTDATSAYLQNHQEKCMLESSLLPDDVAMAVIVFTLDLEAKILVVNCSQHLQNIHIYQNITAYKNERLNVLKQRAAGKFGSDSFFLNHDSQVYRKSRAVEAEATITSESTISNASLLSPVSSKEQNEESSVQNPAAAVPNSMNSRNTVHIPIKKEVKDGVTSYSVMFLVAITREDEEGLYNLNFHNCPNYGSTWDTTTSVNLSITITENNNGNYLSAGEMPLPALYFTMSILFFLSGCFWIFILRKSNSPDVFKIHYVMGVLVYLKSFSLLFHGIHYHCIQTYGWAALGWVEGFAILDYVTHLLKGALMFTTIVLIGTGWAFIKHVLSDKDKKIFMIVIPLQVLANIAEIIMEESQEGNTTYLAWKNVFGLVDLLCCGAILFPVIWSIRHLQEASQTDGKAAINLRKLKVFRHFYIMIVCYIYFSRIIVHLLKITVPFQYEWLDEMFYEMAAFVLFVLTGYQFRPASSNPYFEIPQDESDMEIDQIITQSGVTEGLKKVNKYKDGSDERNSNKRENSLEFD